MTCLFERVGKFSCRFLGTKEKELSPTCYREICVKISVLHTDFSDVKKKKM